MNSVKVNENLCVLHVDMFCLQIIFGLYCSVVTSTGDGGAGVY